jgi:hypothetical protein
MRKNKIKTKDIIVNILLSFLLGVLTLIVIGLIFCIGSALLPIIGICVVGGAILILIKAGRKRY